MTDDEYRDMVKKGIASCHRGDVFQIVLSRRFQQEFTRAMNSMCTGHCAISILLLIYFSLIMVIIN